MATAANKSNSDNYLSELYNSVVVGNEKAVVAFILAAITSFVARHGLKLDVAWQGYLQAALIGLIAHLGVYFTTNSAS